MKGEKGERAKWEPVLSVSSSTEVSGGLFQGGGAGMRSTTQGEDDMRAAVLTEVNKPLQILDLEQEQRQTRCACKLKPRACA